jgi:hypothetical protein
MTISATVLADSINQYGDRMTTIRAVYPRIIHSEVLRHRPLSHSVSSSRAIPVSRMLRNTVSDMAEPVEFGANRPGMQAGGPLLGWRRATARGAWFAAGYAAAGFAWVASKAGAHKQVANRIIEPWTHTVEIISGTDWQSFFDLRIHDDADPTIREFAVAVREAFNASVPIRLAHGDWHLPLIGVEERLNFHTDILRKVSGARCARASYLNHDQSEPVISRDLELARRLIGQHHWSPFEHQATSDRRVRCPMSGGLEGWERPGLHGNLSGFIQDRKLREVAGS